MTYITVRHLSRPGASEFRCRNLNFFFWSSASYLSTVFTLDFLIRINWQTLTENFLDKMLYVDFALLPFYVTVIQQYNLGTYVKKVTDLDFTLMSSNHIVTFAGITKLLRGFKLARVRRRSLVHTARNVSLNYWRCSVCSLCSILFLYILFEFERASRAMLERRAANS